MLRILVPVSRVLAAIEALGYDSQDVRELRIGLHDVTISHNQRVDGKLTGVVITQTVPIHREPADG